MRTETPSAECSGTWKHQVIWQQNILDNFSCADMKSMKHLSTDTGHQSQERSCMFAMVCPHVGV